MYKIGVFSGKSLFELQAERIKALKQNVMDRYGITSENEVKLPWYIMTSPMTDQETKKYFKEMSYFGLPHEDVFFFQQGTLPCMTKTDGKFIMESKHKIATAPDGNGGIYMALHRSGAIQDMKNRGIKGLFTYCVDNALVKVADPVFVGYCIQKNADIGSKVVLKDHADEKVGVLAKRNGDYAVIEYSEMSQYQTKKINKDGSLMFNTGNICIHYYSLDFLSTTCSPNKLSKVYHLANKKIPHADPETGVTITNLITDTGVKLESFIFDIFNKSKNMAVLEVKRSEEFAPVKNKLGSTSDSPNTAREYMSSLHKQWLMDRGVDLINRNDDCEISPLVTYGLPKEVGSQFCGVKIKLPCYILTNNQMNDLMMDDNFSTEYSKTNMNIMVKVIHCNSHNYYVIG